MRLWRLTALVYWLEAPKPDTGRWGPFLRQVAITEAVLLVLWLWISGAFRPLSAL